jgi:hypothetical protein
VAKASFHTPPDTTEGVADSTAVTGPVTVTVSDHAAPPPPALAAKVKAYAGVAASPWVPVAPT